MVQNIEKDDPYVIVTMKSGRRIGLRVEDFRTLAEELSYMIANASSVRELPEGLDRNLVVESDART